MSPQYATLKNKISYNRTKLNSKFIHISIIKHIFFSFLTAANYEPPLTNVFTMQWFLTLFSTCLPKDLVLRVWDLILLEGNEVLLRTALAIWKDLEE